MVKLPPIDTGERILGQNKYTFPSTFWESVASRDYRNVDFQIDRLHILDDDFITEQNEDDYGQLPAYYHDTERDMYNMQKTESWTSGRISPADEYIEYKRNVRSKFNLKDRYISEMKSSYKMMQSPRVLPSYRKRPALGIVPGNEFVEPEQHERILPGCVRDDTVKMPTYPILHYGRKKKYDYSSRSWNKENKPFDFDTEIDYTPRDQRQSRKKYIAGPGTSIKVDDFDGGVPGTPSMEPSIKILPHQVSQTQFLDDSQQFIKSNEVHPKDSYRGSYRDSYRGSPEWEHSGALAAL